MVALVQWHQKELYYGTMVPRYQCTRVPPVHRNHITWRPEADIWAPNNRGVWGGEYPPRELIPFESCPGPTTPQRLRSPVTKSALARVKLRIADRRLTELTAASQKTPHLSGCYGADLPVLWWVQAVGDYGITPMTRMVNPAQFFRQFCFWSIILCNLCAA